jgi:hypothetical protein
MDPKPPFNPSDEIGSLGMSLHLNLQKMVKWPEEEPLLNEDSVHGGEPVREIPNEDDRPVNYPETDEEE